MDMALQMYNKEASSVDARKNTTVHQNGFSHRYFVHTRNYWFDILNESLRR